MNILIALGLTVFAGPATGIGSGLAFFQLSQIPLDSFSVSQS